MSEIPTCGGVARPESAKGVVNIDFTTPIEDSGRATLSVQLLNQL